VFALAFSSVLLSVLLSVLAVALLAELPVSAASVLDPATLAALLAFAVIAGENAKEALKITARALFDPQFFFIPFFPPLFLFIKMQLSNPLKRFSLF
jgi:hypothetical protein